MKAKLLSAKKNLVLAQKGHDLLEVKQSALVQEVRRGEKILRGLKEERDNLAKTAEKALAFAAMDVGCLPPYPYSLDETTAAVDDAFFAQQRLLIKEKEFAEAKAKLSQKKEQLQRVKNRVSALRNISIPMYEKHVRDFSVQIEEHERDEMVRQKVARRLAYSEKTPSKRLRTYS